MTATFPPMNPPLDRYLKMNRAIGNCMSPKASYFSVEKGLWIYLTSPNLFEGVRWLPPKVKIESYATLCDFACPFIAFSCTILGVLFWGFALPPNLEWWWWDLWWWCNLRGILRALWTSTWIVPTSFNLSASSWALDLCFSSEPGRDTVSLATERRIGYLLVSMRENLNAW